MTKSPVYFVRLVRLLLRCGIHTEEEMRYSLLRFYRPLYGDKAVRAVQKRLGYIHKHKLAPWTLLVN
jgi:hypothetical protein